MAVPEVETLRAMWGSLTPPERRELLATRFDALALRREGDSLDLAASPPARPPRSSAAVASGANPVCTRSTSHRTRG
jgi:hypothetical protein